MTYEAQVIGRSPTIEQHVTSSKCSSKIDAEIGIGHCIPEENEDQIIVWRDPHHNTTEMKSLGIHLIQQQGPYVLIPTLQAGGSIQREFAIM